MAFQDRRGGYGGYSGRGRGGYSGRYSVLSDEASGDEWTVKEGKRRRRSTGGRYKDSYNESPAQTVPFCSQITKEEFIAMSGDEKLVALFELGLRASSMNARVTTAENNISHINKQMSFNENRLKLLEYKSIDAEARSRRNNLIFRGVGESLNPDSEDCEEKIREILRNDLRLDYDPVIQRAHRLGPINRRRLYI